MALRTLILSLLFAMACTADTVASYARRDLSCSEVAVRRSGVEEYTATGCGKEIVYTCSPHRDEDCTPRK